MPRPKKQKAHVKKAANKLWTADTAGQLQPGASSTPAASPDRSDINPPTASPIASTSVTSPQPSTSTAAAASPQPSTSTAAISEYTLDIPLSEIPPLPLPEEISTTRSEQTMLVYESSATEEETVVVPNRIRTIVEIGQTEKLIAKLKCHECDSDQPLTLRSYTPYELSLKLEVVCAECNTVLSREFTSSRNPISTSRPRPFLVNEICSMASLLCGIGSYEFKKFCECMDMPGIHPKTFNKVAKRLYDKNAQLGLTIFSKAASLVRQEYGTQYHMTVEENDILDIAVCFDGTWMTRGHKSSIGVCSVIDVLTGLVLDAHVLSLICQTCVLTGECIKRENPQWYDQWKTEHEASRECTINFHGTSGMMEVEGASILWARSVDKHKIRYTTMVSDGDSKAYNRVVQDHPYSPDITIEKEDCLNHVGKRLGTALRNLVADCSKRGITLGGRGHGRLTAETICKLQIYYSRAIRKCKTAQEMKTAIQASVYHGYSTDNLPQHMYRPSGIDSWCFFKRSVAEHKYPAGHKRRIHTPLNYELLHKHIEPIYTRLTVDDLLRRCERKATQNPSEGFHHSIWSRCSKTKFHSLRRVQFAVTTAAAEFNQGPSVVAEIKTNLGFDTGLYGCKFAKARQHKHVTKSVIEATAGAKKRKKMRAEAKEKAREEKQAEEGGSAYGAGMF